MKFVLLTFIASFILVYQNCSKVNLEQSFESEPPYILKGSIDICLDGALSNYTLESHFTTNLNIANYQSKILLDTDGDGIPDSIEEEFGFNPENRYSTGKIQDALCLFQKGGVGCSNITNCNPNTLVGIGLNECDLQAAGLDQFAHPTKGLDSDRDGFLDFIEINKNTLPNVNDAFNDPDKDLVLNSEELKSGTNPNYADKNFDPSAKVIQTSSKMANPSCSGEFWRVEFNNIQIYKMKNYTDKIDPMFSHERNENVVFTSLIFSPKTGFSGNSIVYSFSKKVLHDGTSGGELKLKLSDFTKAGEIKTSL